MYNYSLDLSITDDCNFRCRYCIEKDHHCKNYMSSNVASATIDKIDFLLDNNYFDNINLSFWGGEPTLNYNIVEEFVNRYYKNSRISFNIFSNGYLFRNYYELIDKTINYFKNPSRFHVQISYDGFKVHDKKRKTFDNKYTAQITRDLIIELIKEKSYDINLKSTFSYDDVSDIYESYVDIVNLYEEVDQYQGIIYSPTIDYSTDFIKLIKNREKFEIFKENLIEQISKISIKEFDNIINKKYREPVFTWLSRLSKSLSCSAGYNYHTVNYNGDMYTCHGCLYINDYKDHIFATIFDNNEDFIQKIDKQNQLFKNFERYSNGKCETCSSVVCYTCNSSYYDISEKENFLDRWYDYSDNNMCELYKEISYYIIAWKKIIFENIKY